MSEKMHYIGFPMPSECQTFDDAFRLLKERAIPNSSQNEMIIRLPQAPTYTDIESIRHTFSTGPEYSLDYYADDAWYLIKGQQGSIHNPQGKLPPKSICFHTHPNIYSEGNVEGPSIADAITALIQHPSITWGIFSEAGLTLYRDKDAGKHEKSTEDLVKQRQHFEEVVRHLFWNPPYSYITDLNEWEEVVLREKLRIENFTIPWGDEANAFWSTLTNAYAQKHLFDAEYS